MKICVFTGTRAEYGILRPIIRALDDDKFFDLSLIVTGMHLSSEFGNTINEITTDGFKIEAQFPMMPENDEQISMAKAIGEGIIGCTEALHTVKPDVLIILGDRIEALAACISSVYMNIPVAHFSGGDVTKGGLDESARHAITKFSHIHFPATQESAERIKKMGEHDWRIFPVGEPSLETIKNMKYMSRDKFQKNFKVDLSKKLILLIQHPVTTEVDKSGYQIKETLEAIKELKHQTIIIYPNSDAGGRKIIDVIKSYENLPFIKSYKSLNHENYLNILKYADVLVGNSSSGITEAPSFQLPVVNIGIRQEGRERSTNVIDAPHKKEKIKAAILKCVSDTKFAGILKKCVNPYGDGNTSQKVVQILKTIKIDSELLKKQISY